MPTDTHTQRVRDLAGQRGLLRASDLEAVGAPRVVLTRLTSAGLLEKVGRGLYRLPGQTGSEHESLATVATKVPHAVFCLLTAPQFHELGACRTLVGRAANPSARSMFPPILDP